MIDTHCHLNDPKFQKDRARLLSRAVDAGVERCLVAGYDIPSSLMAVEQSEQAGLYAAVGLHAHDAAYAADHPDWLEVVRRAAAMGRRVVAIGEIGLGYHDEFSPRDVQERVCRAQISLAQGLGLPVTVHCREAEDELLDMLEADGVPEAGCVLHSFTGTQAQAARGLEMGLYIGVTGMATFRKTDGLRDMLRSVPVERLLLETDAPYLAPVPLRGKRNEPANLPLVAEALGTLLRLSAEQVDRQTTANALKVFSRMAQ